MLLNPYNVKLPTIPGTRFLENSFGLEGFEYKRESEPNRVWTLQYLLDSVPNRYLGGIRAKFLDNKGFVSFCNQRDLEVILGLGVPGEICQWSDQEYPGEGDLDWFGLCVDEYDLDDDLFERELRMRETSPVLQPGMELYRLVHDGGKDFSELHACMTDIDDRGYTPDVNFGTITRRWSRIERTPLKWSRL